MSVQLFNTFDVEDQDFQDISCEGCKRNGEHFNFLLLCADCGSFMCNPCMFHHMKNFDENHNTLNTGKLAAFAEGKALDPEIPNIGDESPDITVVEVHTPPDHRRSQMKQEIALLQDLLDKTHKIKTERLSTLLQFRNLTLERITEFKQMVAKELNDMEREIEDLVNLQIMHQSNTIEEDIAKTCQTVAMVKEMVNEMEYENHSENSRPDDGSGKKKYFQKLLQHVKTVSEASDQESQQILQINMENIVRKPLEDFCYKVNKMQHLFANETDTGGSILE